MCSLLDYINALENKIEKKTNKTYVFHLNWLINMKLSPLSSDPPLQKDSQKGKKKKKILQCGTCSPSTGLPEFCPKEPLNRSRNPITS